MDDDLTRPGSQSDSDADRERFARWYELHHERILSQCTRMLRDRAAAEDLTHETLLRAWFGRDQMREEDLGAWLTVVARNLCISYIRKQSRTVPTDDLPETAIEDADPAVVLLKKESSRSVQRALSEVGERHRKILYMREYHDLDVDEIGSELGLSSGSTRAVLFRARQMLRRRLVAVGEGLGAWIAGVRVRITAGSNRARVLLRGGEAGVAQSLQAGFTLALAAGIALSGIPGSDAGKATTKPVDTAIVARDDSVGRPSHVRPFPEAAGATDSPADGSASSPREVIAALPKSPLPPPAAYDPETGKEVYWIYAGPIEFGIEGTRVEDGRPCKTCSTKDMVFTTLCLYDERYCQTGGSS